MALSDFAVVQQALPMSLGSPSWGGQTVCNLQRVGDLLTEVSIEIKVAKTDTSFQGLPTGSFYPAEAIFDLLTLSIGGVELEQLDRDWLRIYDATLRTSEKAQQYMAAANFDPKTITSQAGSVETLYLSVPFCFARNTDQALPIVAMNDTPKLVLKITGEPAAYGFDPAQSPQLQVYGSYVRLNKEDSAKFRAPLHYNVDVVQSKIISLRPPTPTHEVAFNVDLTLTGWIRAMFFAFKSTSDAAGHARYVGGVGSYEQALQPSSSTVTGLGPVQSFSEVFGPLAAAALLIDGNNPWGESTGRWFNVGTAARFLDRLPPPGIYSISLAETPLCGGGGMRATRAKLMLAGRFKPSVDQFVPGDLQSGIMIESNCELHVYALTRLGYSIQNGRFTLDLA